MISSMLYIILVISFMSISLYICFGYIKATYAYLIDGSSFNDKLSSIEEKNTENSFRMATQEDPLHRLFKIGMLN